MKIAINITETLTRTVILEAEDYLEAQNKVVVAYNNGDLQLHAYNSRVEMELNDDTENYIEIFGKDEFESIEISEEFK